MFGLLLYLSSNPWWAFTKNYILSFNVYVHNILKMHELQVSKCNFPLVKRDFSIFFGTLWYSSCSMTDKLYVHSCLHVSFLFNVAQIRWCKLYLLFDDSKLNLRNFLRKGSNLNHLCLACELHTIFAPKNVSYNIASLEKLAFFGEKGVGTEIYI